MSLFQSKSAKRRDEYVKLANEFCHNKKLRDSTLVIFADVETNTVLAWHRGLASAFHNKARSRRMSEMFAYDPEDDKIHGNQSKRNKAIAQFLYEIDGSIDSIGKEVYNIRKGQKPLDALIKAGHLGMGKRDSKGNTSEALVGPAA